MGLTIVIFPWFGAVNGYTAARFYTFFNGSSWTKMAVSTSLFLPCFIASLLTVIDLCESIETGQADTVPLREATMLVYYWFFIHVPSCFCGSYVGFTQNRIVIPVKTNRMEREGP